MNNEIKELIKDMQRFDNKWRNFDTKLAVATYPINQEQMPILLDYITNLQEENEDLREENKEAHDFDETMKDIKDNLIARINRQECEIHNLKAQLEMYENGVYYSSENDKLQERIDKAIAYIKCGKTFDDIETARIIDKYEKILLEILQGSDKE